MAMKNQFFSFGFWSSNYLSWGFFFLKRPLRAFMASAGFCPCALSLLEEERPPRQPSCDLKRSFANPPTSGINFGCRRVGERSLQIATRLPRRPLFLQQRQSARAKSRRRHKRSQRPLQKEKAPGQII